MKRGWLAATATVTASLAIGLLLCETIARLTDGIPVWPLQNIAAYRASYFTTITAAEYEPLLGWRQRAGQSGQGTITTGEFGMRMNSAEIKPLPANAILIVGNSFTAGSDVAEHETYPAQIEQILGHPVINGGVGGYGSDQMILAGEYYLDVVRPAAVIVGILDDDINRAQYSVYGGAPKPWFDLGPDGEFRHHNRPVPAVPQDWDVSPHWLGYSYLAVRTAERLGFAQMFQARPTSHV